ncbi:hypothetical protein C8J98_101448 [Luteibacter sp. OK325]|uniref:post-PEP-CTERM-1 domain-containing protein n=1 Tax=Luteibacter sp. OK325 TaxID=2135670 RepID=UPI000D38AA35|nr:hypothetical protein [Luteibacter sp. OK325]PTR35185.1 hypothetical protein C8J98_101448 [Luteibacter sp. OK325]
MTSRTLAQAIGLVLTGMLMAGAAQAADTPSTQATPKVRAVQAGQQVAIDPVTGAIRAPTDAERAAYSKAFQARQSRVTSLSTQPRTNADAKTTIRKVTLQSGGKATGMRLPQERMSSVVATRAADGSISIHHDDHGAQVAPKAPEVTR